MTSVPRPDERGVSGARRATTTTAASATGTFTRNTDRQPNASVNRPPATGPATSPVPLSAAQTPVALARAAGSVQAVATSASDVGTRSAPATPSSARSPMRTPTDHATEVAAESTANAHRPTRNTRRAPWRSDHAPAVSSRAAKASG